MSGVAWWRWHGNWALSETPPTHLRARGAVGGGKAAGRSRRHPLRICGREGVSVSEPRNGGGVTAGVAV
jgi:hypothetical protein